MKRYINILVSLAALLCAVSCEDYLDQAPDMGLDESDVFSSYESSRGYMDVCYEKIYDYSAAGAGSQGNYLGVQYVHLGSMSDELGNNLQGGLGIPNLNDGNWYDSNTPEVSWEKKGGVFDSAFQALRIASRIIEVVPQHASMTDQQRNELLGQAHFFRAWFYFEIIRRSGGMPNFMVLFDPTAGDFNQKRLNYGESSDLIIAELNQAIAMLPAVWDEANTGRVSKISAMALKSMVELYSASPLMQNKYNELNQITEYNTDRARLAAQYAKECLDTITAEAPDCAMQEGGNYENVFYFNDSYRSPESLFYINSIGVSRQITLFCHWQNTTMTNAAGNWGYSHSFPTQNIVDMYETKNGYPIVLNGRNWVTEDPEFKDVVNTAAGNPYTIRDPRFAKTIAYPGEKWGKYGSNDYYVATWDGGREIDSRPSHTNETGYLCKKWSWEGARDINGDKSGYAAYRFNSIMIRTTQVWLDYAEAMNEVYGPTAKPDGYSYSALDAINKVRGRVGQSPVLDRFTKSKELFRDRIRNERAIELYCENHRMFDIRRWMIAESVLNSATPITGVRVVGTNVGADAPKAGNVFSYEKKTVINETRVFTRKHYWYPLPKDEVGRLYIEQNPGW